MAKKKKKKKIPCVMHSSRATRGAGPHRCASPSPLLSLFGGFPVGSCHLVSTHHRCSYICSAHNTRIQDERAGYAVVAAVGRLPLLLSCVQVFLFIAAGASSTGVTRGRHNQVLEITASRLQFHVRFEKAGYRATQHTSSLSHEGGCRASRRFSCKRTKCCARQIHMNGQKCPCRGRGPKL